MADYSMQCKPGILLPFPVKYKWTETSSQSFKDALCSCSIKQRISNFKNFDTNSSSDVLLDDLENIIFAAANVSLKRKFTKRLKKRHTPKK